MPAPRHPAKVFDPGKSELTPLDLMRVISIAEAERLSSLSADIWYREHSDKLIQLSKRRIGVRLRDALFLSKAT
jgi:hypothetical protein